MEELHDWFRCELCGHHVRDTPEDRKQHKEHYCLSKAFVWDEQRQMYSAGTIAAGTP